MQGHRLWSKPVSWGSVFRLDVPDRFEQASAKERVLDRIVASPQPLDQARLEKLLDRSICVPRVDSASEGLASCDTARELEAELVAVAYPLDELVQEGRITAIGRLIALDHQLDVDIAAFEEHAEEMGLLRDEHRDPRVQLTALDDQPKSLLADPAVVPLEAVAQPVHP